jgi:WD40 repeat protein
MFMRHGAAVYKGIQEFSRKFICKSLRFQKVTKYSRQRGKGAQNFTENESEDGTVRLWDARAGTNPVGLIPGASPYQGVDFHPVGTYFVTANTGLGVE